MKLSDVPIQVDVRVASIGTTKEEKQRLAARGLHQGCTASVIQRIGVSQIISANGTRMVISDSIADKIEVTAL